MKKLILAIVSGTAVLLLAIFGPDLVALYRLQSHVEASSKAYEANGGPWPQLADACIACHGANGNSQHQGYPSLAGQPAVYLAAQLQNFANGRRPNPNMGPLAQSLGEKDVQALADHFARQPVADNRSFQPDPALREKGRQLVNTQNCAACHGDRLMGREQFPRLAGQGYDYLLAQFDAFASGRRTEVTGLMRNISAAASAEDRKAIATYLASLASSTAQPSPRNPQE